MRSSFDKSHTLNLLLCEFHLHDPLTVSGQKQSLLRIKCPRFTNPQLAAPFAPQIICERIVPPTGGFSGLPRNKGNFSLQIKGERGMASQSTHPEPSFVGVSFA